jgi:hypothetical protein
MRWPSLLALIGACNGNQASLDLAYGHGQGTRGVGGPTGDGTLDVMGSVQ